MVYDIDALTQITLRRGHSILRVQRTPLSVSVSAFSRHTHLTLTDRAVQTKHATEAAAATTYLCLRNDERNETVLKVFRLSQMLSYCDMIPPILVQANPPTKQTPRRAASKQ